MKVIHVVGHEVKKGGAALGALNLHNSLLEIGVDSQLLQLHRNNLSAIQKIKYFFYRIHSGIMGNLSPVGFDYSGIGLHLGDYLPKCDIVHIHSLGRYFCLQSIAALNIPVIITLRDYWWFTGGCHYPVSCSQYLLMCNRCTPDISSSLHDRLLTKIWTLRAEQVVKKQLASKANIHYVAISKTVQTAASNSSILAGKPVRMIYNSIDPSFQLRSKTICRSEYRISTSDRVVLIGALNLTTYYKGFSYLIDVLNALKPDPNILIATFGQDPKLSSQVKHLRHLHLGSFSDARTLSGIYSLADIFLCTSSYEAFGKTVAESMACGTPIACFDNTGPAEISRNTPRSLISPQYYTAELAVMIEEYMQSPINNSDRRSLAEYAQRNFCSSQSALKYSQLYTQTRDNFIRHLK